MNEQSFHSRQPPSTDNFGIFSRVRRACTPLLPHRFYQKLNRISHRLTLLVIGLVTLLTLGSAALVINILDNVLLTSMIQRGAASVSAIAGSAGYSILAEDQLALDNLVAQGKKAQEDLAYVAILDTRGKILAHDQLDRIGHILQPLSGELVEQDTRIRVSKVSRQGQKFFEFDLPVNFAGRQVGEVVVGLDPRTLVEARSAAHWRILFVCGLTILFGVIGAIWLSRLFTRPITQLSHGVERLKLGTGKVFVPIFSQDELGELTNNFNVMAADLALQRKSLIEYSDHLEKSYHDIVQILAGALDARDNYTYGHSARVAQLAVMLGHQLNLEEKKLKELEMACLLHDIGKIRVPDNILNKQAPLNAQENSRIRQHPEHGVEILALADSLHPYIPTVRHHHEWYNGSGYPDGLNGEEIPLCAQIVAITDAYDAMTTSRPYRSGLSNETALAEILRYRGSQFAPELTDIFVAMLQNRRDANPSEGEQS